MNKRKKLPESIKDIIQLHGTDVVRDSRLSNILNDVISFDDLPAAKVVLHTILKDGYGRMILEMDNLTSVNKLKIRSYSSEIANKYGYKQEIVDYLLFSIVYGLGWTNSLPSYKSISQSQNEQGSLADRNIISDLNSELDSLKKEYLLLLKKLLIVPDKTSAFFPASALTQLELVEGKIGLLYEALKTKDNGWCKEEKDKILKAHYKDTSALKQRVYMIVAISIIVMIVCGFYGITYFSSLDDMNCYRGNIKEGDACISSGLYDQAISKYKEAYINYNAFNSNNYKHDAYMKIEAALDKMIEESETDNKMLLSTYTAIRSELQLDLSTEERENTKEKLALIENEINNRVSNGKHTLVLNLSANKGNLNVEGKKLLHELLDLSPKDYWLNFINKKCNE